MLARCKGVWAQDSRTFGKLIFFHSLPSFWALMLYWYLNFETLVFEKGKSASSKCLTGIHATPTSSLPWKQTPPAPRGQMLLKTIPRAPASRWPHTQNCQRDQRLTPRNCSLSFSDAGRTPGTPGFLSFGFGLRVGLGEVSLKETP